MNKFNDIIYTRRSIRKYSCKPIEKEKVDLILKSALLAPCGKRFDSKLIVVDDINILKSLSEAKKHGASLLSGATLAIVIASDTQTSDVWIENSSIVATYIMLKAEDLGLGCCWVNMHLRTSTDGKSATDNLRETLKLPDNYEVHTVMSIGYADEEKPAYTDADLKKEKVYLNKIGNSYKL